MKGDGDLVFEPTGEDDEKAEGEAEGGSDALLGNAFDAFQDGDREGFIRSMRAALRDMKD